jgi:hypothetical protein
MSSSTQFTHGLDNLAYAPLQQETTVFFHPSPALCDRPVFVQARHLSQMLDGMIEINQFIGLYN